MFDLNRVLLFMTATLALNLSPGPDVLFVLANSARHGARGGVFASLGISAGIVIHTCLAAVGVAAVLLTHRWVFELLRVAGAAYLIWLGLCAWRAPDSKQILRQPGGSPTLILARGMLTNVLNPKVALFFLAFLPQFVDPARDNVALQVLAFGALFVVSGTLVNIGYAWAGGRLSQALRRDNRWRRRLNRISGSILIALGGRLLISSRAS